MAQVGYSQLVQRFGLACPPLAFRAETAPVGRVLRTEATINVPSAVVPGDAPIEQLLFAVRYQGVDQAVIDALANTGGVSDAEIVAAVNAAPSGQFARRLGYAWELVTGRSLEGVSPRGPYVGLFDEALFYASGPVYRNTKWRVDFNGLGTPQWCPVVRRTAKLTQMEKRPLFDEVAQFADEARSRGLLDRVLNWAYLAETRSSYAIESEEPPHDKAQAFAELLRTAHAAQPIHETYLTHLQNAVVTNPASREPGFRERQNWLARGGVGALAVRYVPPAPDTLPDLMADFCEAVNSRRCPHPLMQASLNSFGFVYLHPFMDGNGRLSRFLFHHALCGAKVLTDGQILPVSMAMQQDEAAYLGALEAYSKPLRDLWDVTWIDGAQYVFATKCRPSAYRYWDATPQVEFGWEMAHRAVDVHLKREAAFLQGFDAAFAALDKRLDLPGVKLHDLILRAYEQGGRLSLNRRKQYAGQLPEAWFDEIELEVQQAFGLEPVGSH